MPRSASTTIENNFKGGLVTEASGLNFPESACTDTYNCIFSFDGSVQRRLGFDFESDSTTKTIDRDDSVVVSYLWKNVAGDGNVSLLVLQVGATLYFYETDETATSQGAVVSNISLSAYSASGAPTPELVESQFSNGNGLLFVTHPYCTPFYVSYNTTTQTATATGITIQIRDFEGDTADSNAVDTRPTSTLAALNVNHKYNLYNQGWNTTNLTAWDTAQTTMPSNVDVMWTFKNSSDDFDASTAAINRVVRGNTPAPKGHFIMTVWDQNRDTVSGFSGCTSTSTSYQRPSTSCFHNGRVFYSGINYVGFNSSIYFTQIVERNEQYGFCYQSADPTSEDIFDLVSSDGGVIKIPEAGTIYKLVTIPGGIAVFAANGTWVITGSTGLGFSATDFTVSKLSSIGTNNTTSFVDIAGFPAWWNQEGIYILTTDGNNPQIKSLTDDRIKTFYNTIPPSSKRQARGFFNLTGGVAQWLFRSTEAGTPTEIYEYDYILNYNVLTGAFYPWSISPSTTKVHALFVMEGTSGVPASFNVVNDSGDLVVDDSGNQVVAYDTSALVVVPAFKYIVSTASGSTYNFTFAEERDTSYLDWVTTGTNYDYPSYFVSGYKIHGDANRKFQANYVNVYSRTATDTKYTFQGLWDYALSSDTGRWGTAQTVYHNMEDNYANGNRRLKVRGHGKALQFKVESVTGFGFDIIGWSAFESANSAP